MRFEEVLPALREGKKIRKRSWCKDTYIYINYCGRIVTQSGSHYDIILNGLYDLKHDGWEIFEAPKKVKLRDLSKRKYVNWWYRHCFEQNKCEVDCPLKNAKCDARFTSSWINHKDLYSDKFLDQEIEVEE